MNIKYGNPTQKWYNYANENSYLDILFDELKNEIVPANDSEVTKEELNEIVESINLLNDPENTDFLQRYKLYDSSVLQAIHTLFMKRGIVMDDVYLEIQKDVLPLVAKLKIHFNRARPGQLAYYHKLKLFPYDCKVDSASFPSSNVVLGHVILEVIGSKYPELYNFCNNIKTDIENSRVFLGQNFTSDIEFSKKVANKILKNKKFSLKYSI
jgi:hypothetical protein